MDCAGFTRWLDEGAPARDRAEAAAHAAGCPGCAAALRIERALEAALGPGAVRAPDAFAERVMERIARVQAARLAAAEAETLPWWVRAAAEPAAALALALAALVWWQSPALLRGAARVVEAVASPAATHLVRQVAVPRLALDLSAVSNPFLLLGLVLALAPLAWWAGLSVYHWSGDPLPAPGRLHASAPRR